MERLGKEACVISQNTIKGNHIYPMMMNDQHHGG